MKERLLLTAAFLMLIAAIIFFMIKVSIYFPVLLVVGAFGCGAAYLNFKN